MNLVSFSSAQTTPIQNNSIVTTPKQGTYGNHTLSLGTEKKLEPPSQNRNQQKFLTKFSVTIYKPPTIQPQTF